MTSNPLPDGQGQHSHKEEDRAALDERFRQATAKLDFQRRQVRALRQLRRRERHRATARWARRRRGAILFWTGTAAATTGALLLALDQRDLALNLFMAAVSAWFAALTAERLSP
ncbi:hypothetical protein [Streptomyces sp. NPDC059063]|uniref:hypothetical protein n=1 Tax=unclassified Streptomyces TaxID=2593676 RepID=UPI0036C8ED11